MASNELRDWFLENIFGILMLVLISTSSYMLKMTLEDLKTSVDQLSNMTATQDVRLEAHSEQINQLQNMTSRLDNKLNIHSERWTSLYREGEDALKSP